LLPCIGTGSACEQVSLPAVEYFAEPYGFGTDDGVFSDALHCLLQNELDTCPEAALLAPMPYRQRAVLNVIWVTDRDICAADADGCSEFRQLNQLADGSHALVLSVIAAVPPQLVAAQLAEGDWYASRYAALLANPALPPPGERVACGTRSSDARAPRNLIAQLQDGIPVASLCAPDESLLAVDIRLQYEGGGYVEFDCNHAFGRLTPAADGTVPCAWTERLPIAGPITHCSQLDAYGRQPLAVDPQTTAETCTFQQPGFTDGHIQGQQGYAYARMSNADAVASGFKPWCRNWREDAPRFWVPRAFTPIPGSSLRMVCTTQDDMTCR
jgi:hypothetical protein